MRDHSVLDLLNDASAMLQIASDELSRPGDDVVTISACQCIRNSVNGFFRSYLLEKKSLFKFHDSLEKLLSECIMLDHTFASIDISCFICKKEDGDCSHIYCVAHHRVHECFERAKMIKEFVLSKLNLRSELAD